MSTFFCDFFLCLKTGTFAVVIEDGEGTEEVPVEEETATAATAATATTALYVCV